MSGFGGGGYGPMIRNLTQQIQNQNVDESGAPPGAAPQTPGTGPGEAQNMNYGQGGSYNTLTQDMSRNVQGDYAFTNGMFNYNPFGNPYAPTSPPPSPMTPPPGAPPGEIPPDLMFDRGSQYRDNRRFASWPGSGFGSGMPGRGMPTAYSRPNMYGGSFGGSGYGMSGGGYKPFGYMPYGGAMPYGGGSGMYGGRAMW